MLFGKLSVPGQPTDLDNSGARVRVGVVWTFFSFLCSFSLSVGEGPILTEILSQRAVKPKTTKQSDLGLFA